jgi:chaperone BCS1
MTFEFDEDELFQDISPPPTNMLGSIQGVLALQLASQMMNAPSNGTGAYSQELLERFVPGFGTLHSLILNHVGIDITLAVSWIALSLAAFTSARWAWKQIFPLMLNFCTSMVSIPSNDRLNKEILAWMSAQIVEKHGTRALAAVSAGSGDAQAVPYHPVPRTRRQIVREQHMEDDLDDRTPAISFFPAVGTQWFWFHGWPFIFERKGGMGYGAYVEVPTGNEPLIIRCLGRNPEPLKRFLHHCKEAAKISEESKTPVYSQGDRMDRFDPNTMWCGPQLVLNRPLETVELDDQVKENLVNDVMEYLKPETREYYAINGIPYRRGYLFHGPPGTGKSSFCRALAGQFRLELYMLSLASKSIDEQVLIRMFEALPTKCLVLMEDVDSAGIVREDNSDSNNLQDGPPNPPPIPQPPPPGLVYAPYPVMERKPRITLSTLLNVIDGAAAKEGRILVMTTNSPESLDKALVRPGRVDKQVLFPPMSRQSASRIFTRMLSVGKDRTEIEKLAEAFASKLPDGEITPAEIQGFLLDHRNSPEDAVKNVEKWSLALLEAKELGKNVIELDE